MKKLLAMLCALIACCLFGGCGEKEAENTNSDPTESKPTNSESVIPDTDGYTKEELDEFFSSYPFDFDEPIVLPDDET